MFNTEITCCKLLDVYIKDANSIGVDSEGDILIDAYESPKELIDVTNLIYELVAISLLDENTKEFRFADNIYSLTLTKIKS